MFNVELAVALDSPAQQRDFEVQSGDDYTVSIDVYADEADTTVDPETLAGLTLTFERLRYPSSYATAVGNTFTFEAGPPAYVCPRVPYRIVATDADGLRQTLCYGNVITREVCLYAWGLLGNDYGWFV